ncbi:MAG: sugar ABC transporter permease [Saccharofermentans sp.]|nr:sugar ABC transporter permease [Clostridiales bacterium]MCR4767504.1 sugar ABC transporter permease [Saccharofermentans sp.]
MSKKVELEKRYSKWGYIFVIPFVVLFLLFHFLPMANTIYYAFCDLKNQVGNYDPKFLPSIGEPWYRNFAEVFKAVSFRDAFKNTLFFWLAEMIPEWIIAFWLAAVMTDRRLKIKGRKIFRSAFIFPKIVAGSGAGNVLLNHMIMFVGTGVGFVLMASMMNGFGITEKDVEFFTSMPFFIIVVSIFVHFGIVFIYAVAGITGIPVEIFEAAEMDGANRIQTFFRVTLPCMKPMMFFITVVSIVDGLGMVDIPSMFGAFDTFRRNLTLMMYVENQAFMGSYIYDRASAASLIMLCIYGSLATVVYFIFIRDKDEVQIRKMKRKERREEKKRLNAD